MLHVRDHAVLTADRPAPVRQPGSPGAGRARSGHAPESVPEQRASRDPYFDNVKYLAIVLVAMGHAWTPLMDSSRAAAALYMFVYTFHMPAFIVVAGYFSRSFTGRPDQLRRLVTGIGVPYLVFEVAYIAFHRQVNGTDHPWSLLDPYYVTWFLLALFVWRLTAPFWRIIRYPLPVALGIAALASVSPELGDDFNISRVLQFLPFFVLGLTLRREHFERLRRPDVRLIAVPAFVGALVVAYWAVPRMSARWFYRTNSAQEMGHLWWTGPLMTLALFGAGLVLTAAFLAWVPEHATWYTALGAGTLYGYLLHGFLAKGSRWWGWYEAEWVATPLGQVTVTVLAAAIVTALCTSPVRTLFQPVVEPGMSWAFRPSDRPRGGSGAAGAAGGAGGAGGSGGAGGPQGGPQGADRAGGAGVAGGHRSGPERPAAGAAGGRSSGGASPG
ncbi:acyltransferase family protein [Streptomyces lonarensis]|uniref:Acyltransferase family protein n=1 Tax=Streptomyces lonarensis TaxID=700599 RepID=A0A7X6CYH3_9ACTN|nr:acyltransferase family protein [Streptomyces lonarensis]NJQ04759.1 acyltransferase family protein [Streptomyces lonarensis]